MIGKKSLKKRMRNSMLLTIIILCLLLFRIGYLQFVEGGELKRRAYLQQTSDRSVNPKRGTIYDATGEKVLAVSSTVQTITVNPTVIQDKEKVARKLSELFELDYEKTLKKVSS